MTDQWKSKSPYFMLHNQLYQVRPHHFSLVLAAVENSNLTAFGFFEIDKETCQLEGSSADNMEQVCEFSARDRPGFEKIVKDPKEFKKLGVIKKDSVHHEEQAAKDYASGLFLEVLQKQRTLDDAYTDLVAFKKRLKWVQAISKSKRKLDRAVLLRDYRDQELRCEAFFLRLSDTIKPKSWHMDAV